MPAPVGRRHLRYVVDLPHGKQLHTCRHNFRLLSILGLLYGDIDIAPYEHRSFQGLASQELSCD
eukprot:6536375-Lingulodinium_polyedra.AAC.1